MSRILACALVCALCCTSWIANRAEAQTGGRWLVIPYGVQENDEAVIAADRVHLALQDLELTVISAHEARDKYVVGSRIPESLASKDIELLIKEGQEALEHVAYGRHVAAQKSVREALGRAERALETLNRKTETARRVLDACLILVRSELGQDNREGALETAMRCRRLVPDISPNETTHPASVIGVLAEAENKLRRWQVGKLQVDSTPQVGCSVYVNGRHLGITPFVLDRAPEGAYRVQVECDSVVGRVHEVTLGEKPVVLAVDSLLDRALRSEPRLTLTYAEPKLARTYGIGHASAIGRQVGADDVVLVSAKDQQLTLVRVQISQGRAIAEATITRGAKGFGEDDLERAVETLLAGRTIAATATQGPPLAREEIPENAQGLTKQEPESDRTGDERKPPVQAAPAEPSVQEQRQRRLTIAGVALGTLGIGALVTGWGYELRETSLRADLRDTALDDPKLGARERNYERARELTHLGIAGSLLMTAAVPLLLPKASSVPWWSYLLGGAGVALVGAGAVELALRLRCIAPTSDGGCLERRNQSERGWLQIESGLPLIAVPVTHALRLAWGRKSGQIGPQVRADTDSVLFGAKGSF